MKSNLINSVDKLLIKSAAKVLPSVQSISLDSCKTRGKMYTSYVIKARLFSNYWTYNFEVMEKLIIYVQSNFLMGPAQKLTK